MKWKWKKQHTIFLFSWQPTIVQIPHLRPILKAIVVANFEPSSSCLSSWYL